MQDKVQSLEDQLLITLSYLEAMSLEYIYLDFDKNFLLENPELTIEDLESCLVQLQKKKRIKKLTKEKQTMWIRISPRPNLYKRLVRFLKL